MVYMLKESCAFIFVVCVLFFRFNTDRATYGIERQFLWGPSLLITPVLEEVQCTKCTIAYYRMGLWGCGEV